MKTLPVKLRVLNDLTGKSRVFDITCEPLELILEAKRLQRRVKKEQSLFRLCLHVTASDIVLHWYSEDEKFASAISNAANTVTRATAELLEGRVST